MNMDTQDPVPILKLWNVIKNVKYDDNVVISFFNFEDLQLSFRNKNGPAS